MRCRLRVDQMRSNASSLPFLKGLYLEDSYVLAIVDEPGRFAFKLDAVLTPENLAYKPPKINEQYCYHHGDLIFDEVTAVDWLERSFQKSIDASGEEDLGNIDSLTFEGGAFLLEGDWGVVKIWCRRQPRFVLDPQ